MLPQDDDIPGIVRYRTYEVLKGELADPRVKWCVHARVLRGRACVRVHVRGCMHVCVRLCVRVCARLQRLPWACHA